MLEMLVVANSAFQIIKQTIQNGKEISSAGSAIANFIGAEDKLQKDLYKKKNSIWNAFLGRADNDLEEFMALEEIRVKKDQLREFMQLYGRANLYTDYIAYCAEARRNRKQDALARAKQRAKFQETILKVTLAILITGVLAGAIGVLLIIARKKGII
jgi:hypothetical protein